MLTLASGNSNSPEKNLERLTGFFFPFTAVTAIPLAPHPQCVTQSQASVCVGQVSRAKCVMCVKWAFLAFPPEAAEVHTH